MHVFVSNESPAKLILADEEIESGDYTPGWSPPSEIGPGERKGFQGEGDLTVVATTGTEGRVRYRIVDSADEGELYIHWNSPLVESQYENTFHIWAPVNWEVTSAGGQGHDATLEVRLRRTALRTVPRFHVDGRGFAFENSWPDNLTVISLGYLWNKLFDAAPGPLAALGAENVLDNDFGPITSADAGLCGGMVYTVMDYYAHGELPPPESAKPTADDDPLFNHFRDRLWDSFDIDGDGHRWLGYSSPMYPNGDEGVFQTVGLTRGRSWITYREAIAEIIEDIDAGRLSPIGLIHSDSWDIGKNHQVLAYGYEKSGQEVTLHISDPNHAHKEVTYTFDVTDTTGAVHIKRDPNEARIFCLFKIHGYVPKRPPQGHRTRSAVEALRATMPRNQRRSLRAAMGSRVSVADWLQSV